MVPLVEPGQDNSPGIAPRSTVWPVNWVTFCAVLLLLVVCAAAAHVFDFPLIVWSGQSPLTGQLMALTVLWSGSWICLVLIRGLTKQRTAPRAVMACVCAVTLVGGAAVAAWEIVAYIRIWWPVVGLDPVALSGLAIGVALPLLSSAIGAAGLVFLSARIDRALRPEPHCRKCGYNLTGNVSGACPECGQAITQERARHVGKET